MKRNTRSVRSLVCLALFSLLMMSIFCTLPASADELYASIRGTVTDQSGALVPEARITVTNVATGLSKTATSKDGEFAILQLPVGNYSVKIEKSGFRTYTASGIHLDVNQVYALNAKIDLGAVSESVTVEANQVQVETTTPQRGDVVDANQIVDLPLIGRDWVNLQQLESGVVAASDGRGEFATNGSQTTQNSFLINGTDTNDLPLNTRTVVPSEDAIEEFRMVTNTINPEYGRNSGAIMNAIIKSGSNSFHGDVFEFYRDTFLNASDWFTHTPAIFHQNTFGGTIGGPVWKNHSFFFFSYQGTRNRQPEPNGAVPSSSVYTVAQRTGDFSASPSFYTAANPEPAGSPCGGGYTGPFGPNPLPFAVGAAAAGTPWCVAFPTGVLSTADFNSIAAKLMSQYVPLPNSGTNTFTFNPIQQTTDDQYIFRIDQNLGKRDLLWGSWLQESFPFTGTIPFPGTGATLPGFGETNQQHFKLLTLSWSHTLNDHMINELRGGYNRFNFAAVVPQNVVQPSTLGFNITPQDPSAAGVPAMFIGGLFNLGFSQNGPQPRIDQTYEVVDNFSFTHGSHTMKAGWDMRRFEVNNPFFAQNTGAYQYNGTGTYSTGVGGADFLLGIPDSFAQASGGNGIDRAQEYYSYFQDQWRMRPNFTFTYGLGWTIDTALQDLAYNGHGMAAWYPGQQSVIFPNAPVGVVYSGDPGVHPTGTNHPFRNFGPRIGFAYSPDFGGLTGGPGKTSIRGGFGMYYNRTEEELNLQFQGVPPNSIASSGAAAKGGSPSFANPYADIAGKFPTAGNPFPFTGAPANVLFTAETGYLPIWSLCCSTIDPRNVDPTSYNYNLTLERQLSGSMILSVGYVGALGRHLELGHPLNLVNTVAPCLANPSCNVNNQLFTEPGDFLYPGNLYGTIDQISNMGTSHYNSLQAGLKKKLSRGLQFTANYTWSHSFDNGSGFENSSFGGGGFGGLSSVRAYNPYLPKSNYGPSIYDARNRLVVGYVYELPHPHSGNGLLTRATKGWTISGITTFQSGFPMDVIDVSDPSLHCYGPSNSDFACMDVPNLVAPVQYLNPRTTNASTGVAQWFSAASFASAAPGTFGDAPRNLLRGPGINNWDFQLFKDTNISETTRLELRIEFYNVFNHENFWQGGISTVLQSPTFGQATADNPTTGQGPRLIQLAAKFYF
jgi:carboxypeptidase family protein